MVGFVEDEQVDLAHGHERMHQTLIEHIGSADDDHVLLEVGPPDFVAPQITSHVAAEPFDLLVEVAFKHGILLEDERDAINLSLHQRDRKSAPERVFRYEEERNPRRLSRATVLELFVQNVSEEQDRNQRLARSCSRGQHLKHIPKRPNPQRGVPTGVEHGDRVLRSGSLEQLELVLSRIPDDDVGLLLRDEHALRLELQIGLLL